MKRSCKGFTLIELLIVIMILGVLGSISIALLFHLKERAAIASMESDLGSAYKAAIDHYSESPGIELTPELLHEHGYNPSPNVTLDVQNGFEETLMLAASHPFVSGLYRMDSKGHLLPP